jgi:hypothetical protein
MVRQALERCCPEPIAPGPVEVEVLIRCGSNRNWIKLWKPLGDAMGPMLGYSSPGNPFNPRDDRIVDLTFIKEIDDSLGNRVVPTFWWRGECKPPVQSHLR